SSSTRSCSALHASHPPAKDVAVSTCRRLGPARRRARAELPHRSSHLDPVDADRDRPRAAVPVGVLAAAFLFNLGQGVLRPSLPLYLQATFRANYRLVTSIPTVFGLGKWLAGLPTGLALDRVGRRPVMIIGVGGGALL